MRNVYALQRTRLGYVHRGALIKQPATEKPNMKPQNILAHKGGISMDSLEDFASLKDPIPMGPKHYPTRHDWSFNEVKEGLVPQGWRIDWEQYVLHQDQDKNIDNAFMLLGIGSTDMQGNDYERIIGARNSGTQHFSLQVGAGNRVFVCDNMAFCAEFVVGRKHTKNIMRDVPILMGSAMADISNAFMSQDRRIELYKGIELDRKGEHDIMMECVRRGAVPPSQLNHWIKEVDSPSHEEFTDSSAWSFQNSFTEVAKRWNFHTMQHRTEVLTGVMDRVLDIESEINPEKNVDATIANMEDAEVTGIIV